MSLPRIASRRTSGTGFSLAEMMVAMALFSLVMLAAYQVFHRSNEGYQRGQNQAELIQSVRVGFEQMVGDIRMAGYEFDLDGTGNSYPDQADEPIEYMGATAIIVRGNYDFNLDDPLRGREPGLEYHGGSTTTCCPVVTTGNDEIVGYALGKADNSSTGQITARFDLTGTPDTADSSIRDATANASNVPSNEEAITIPNVELASSPTNPPYVLYRFTWSPADGSLVRQPLVDNIRSLSFTYYDKDDTVINPVGGADGANNHADRDTRFTIRRITVQLEGMEPEQDLRYVDYSDSITASKKHRKFLLTEVLTPLNLGQRGVVDRSTTTLQPVSDVQVCTGQCEMVRVSWQPSPDGSRVVDQIINLYTDAAPHATSPSSLIAEFERVGNYDTVPDPDQEYSVLNYEDSNQLTNGRTVYAQVIARDQFGTESLPVESSDNSNSAVRSGTIGDTTRPDPPSHGQGSGYDWTNGSWPNAKKDNVSGAGTIQIVTDPSSPYYPQADQITVGFQPPAYVLNVGGAAPSGQNNWTTQDLAGGISAAMTCHRSESTPNDNTVDLRTPIAELRQAPGTTDYDMYVFRVSGSDAWNWDEDGNSSSGATDPRNFVPSKRNLIAAVAQPFTSSSTVTWVDSSSSSYVAVNGGSSQYDMRFDHTDEGIRANNADGGSSYLGAAKAVVPGEVYYYRFRVADLCWKDNAPEDGQDDNSNDLYIWSVRKDFNSQNTWRSRALRISPFYPPLLRNSSGALDKADQTVADSDDYNSASALNTYAIPGYALPAVDANGNYIKPEKPTEFYIAEVNESSVLIPGNGTRLAFNAAKRNEPTDGSTSPASVAYATYELRRIAATVTNPAVSELNGLTASNGATVARFRANAPNPGPSGDASLGQLPLLRYSLDTASEGAPTSENSGIPQYLAALQNLASNDTNSANGWADAQNHIPYIYRLFTVQCNTSAIDDQIDTSSAEKSSGSPPFIFPCQFYDSITSFSVSPLSDSAASNATSVSVTLTANTEDAQPTADANCTNFQAGRLLAFYAGADNVGHTGDFVGTSNWLNKDGSTPCQLTFGASDVSTARRGFTGACRYVVEVSDTAVNGQPPGESTVQGCRVRSDMPGAGAASSGVQSTGCNPDCGSNNNQNSAKILGAVSDSSITLENNNTTLDLTVEIHPCSNNSFSLKQVEVDFSRTDGTTMPAFSSAQITSGLTNGMPYNLPASPDYNGSINGDNTKLRVRWYNAFQGNYPTVDGSASGNGSPRTLVIKFNFNQPVCNTTVSSFNFRVPYTNGSNQAAELLCTNRNDDPNNPANNNPPGTTGNGRGPQSTPAASCGCQPQCVDANGNGWCPLNDAGGNGNTGGMSDTPDPNVTTELLADSNGNTQRRVRVDYVNNCTPCSLSLTYIEVNFGTCCGRNCSIFQPLPRYVSAQLIQDGDGTAANPPITNTLPTPSGSPESNACTRHYTWANLSGISIRPGENIHLDITFNGAMNNTQFNADSGNTLGLTIKFGSPFVNVPVCSPHSSDDNLPKRIPWP